MKKISQFPQITDRNNDDWLLIEEAATGAYKRIKVSDFISGLSDSSSGGGGQSDSLFSSVLLLLKGSTIGSNFIVDSSNYARTFNNIGAPVYRPSPVKYESSSIYFNDSSGIACNSTDFNFTGDFSLDFWFRPTDLNNLGTLIDFRPDGTNGNYPSIYLNNQDIGYTHNGTDVIYIQNVINQTEFYYLGFKRVNGNNQLWLNGSLLGSYNSGIYTNSSRILIGANAFRNPAPTTYFYGDICGFRVTNANRDVSQVPTTPFPSS